MSRKRREIEESSSKVPAYIVTFSDMVTLLLTFFVMLMTLANTRDPELFNKGRGALIQSIKEFGLGMFYGRRERPNFGNTKIRYFIHESDKLFEGRTIDAKEENVRRIFQKVNESVKTMPSQIVAKKTNFSVTDISFELGDATLNEPAKKFLTQFVLNLQQSSDFGAVKLYVLGLAGEEKTEKQQWILSAKRAQAIADFLNDILPSEAKWPVYSWGAGPGGDWVTRDSPISRQSHILIAVLRTSD